MATSPSDRDRSARGDGDGPTQGGADPHGRQTPTPPGSPPSGGAGSSDASGTGSTAERSSRRATPGKPPAGGSGASGDRSPDRSEPAEPVTPPTPFTQQLGRVTIVVLAVLFGVFAVANSQRVDFSWVFGETIAREAASGEVTGGVPLILLLVAAFAIGSLVTLLVELFVSRGRRARRAAKEGPDGKER
ncbi:MAG: LapA family protein [Nitriliruptoraceae bacterium]